MAALLEVSNLEVRFGVHRAVQQLSFHIGRGETLALVGESGCGKSATALSLMQLLPAPGRISGGSIHLAGQDLLGMSARQLRDIRGRAMSMIFQEPMTSLNPVLTVGAQIAEVLRRHDGLSHAAARRRAIELLDQVRIPEPGRRADAYPHNLSGGQRQRVMIAIAIACRPHLLIADEPTTALDVTIQAEVLELLDRLRREMSMALLLITHDLGLVDQWADRVIVMYAGRKMEEASAAALFSGPAHPYTRGLLGASLRLEQGLFYRDQRLAEIPGSIESAGRTSGCPFAPRCARVEAGCTMAMPAPQRLDATAAPSPVPHLVACGPALRDFSSQPAHHATTVRR